MFIKYSFFYVCINIVIICIAKFYHPVFYAFGFLYSIFLYYHFNSKVSIFCLLISIVFICTVQYPKTCEDVTLNGKIVNVNEKYIIVVHKQAKIKVYGEFKDCRNGDDIELEVTYFEIGKVRNDNAFHYQRFLYAQGIMQQAYCTKIIRHTPHNTPFTWLRDRINNDSESSHYVSLFILGIKTEEMEDIYSTLTNLSIVHIFALSGMHIHVLKKWLYSILRFLVSNRYVEYVILILIGGYLYIIPENISFMRAYLVMVIYLIGKKYITRLDALAIACMITIFRNPYVVYHVSFIFSYVMYLFVLLIGKYKYGSWLLYFTSIPIILSLQYQLQITSIFLVVVFTPVIKALYILCLWYVLLGPLLAPIIQGCIFLVESMILLSNVIAVVIPFSKPNIFFIGMYYFIICQIIIKINKKRSYTTEMCKILCLLFFFFIFSRYSPVGKVVMIDVGQGDCFLIKQPFNKGNILIDTGGSMKRDIASDTLIPYLRSEGIFSLDYVFISHDDMDHVGALESLNEQMEIQNIITTYQENMRIGDVTITMYPLQLQTRDGNANSLIFKAEVNTVSYLFTGDIGEDEEKILLDTYGNIPVDVLKVPHHGSKYSTSYALLQATNPKMAFISCGENNMYHHPHKEVINKLERYGIHVYRTDVMGMVTVWYVGNSNYVFK